MRRRPQRDDKLGPDFRELVEECLRAARLRTGDLKSWSVPLPAAVFEDYARLARHANVSIGDALREAILRDFRNRQGALDPFVALSETVLGYHRAAKQLVDQANTVIERLGAVQDLANRLTRLEKAISSAVVSR